MMYVEKWEAMCDLVSRLLSARDERRVEGEKKAFSSHHITESRLCVTTPVTLKNVPRL